MPFAAIPIPEDSGACKMSPMNGSCIILNCCNSKIATCFTTLMPVVFSCTRRLSVQPFNNYIFPDILHSHDHQHPDRLQVFQEEVPRAKARQQLREAQNNDASRGLSEETGWLWGGKIQNPPNPLFQVLHPSVAK